MIIRRLEGGLITETQLDRYGFYIVQQGLHTLLKIASSDKLQQSNFVLSSVSIIDSRFVKEHLLWKTLRESFDPIGPIDISLSQNLDTLIQSTVYNSQGKIHMILYHYWVIPITHLQILLFQLVGLFFQQYLRKLENTELG